MTSSRSEKEERPRYGQVYRTAGMSALPEDARWRGVIWYDDHGIYKPLASLLPEDTPDKAFDEMVKAGKEHGVTDLRRWSGTWPLEG